MAEDISSTEYINDIDISFREHFDNLYIKCNQNGSYSAVLQED